MLDMIFSSHKNWEEAFDEARRYMAQMGYFPIDNPSNIRDEVFLFLVDWKNKISLKQSLTMRKLSKRVLDYSDLTGVNFQTIHFTKISLCRTRLKNANFVQSNFNKVEMYSVDIEGANFSASKMNYVNFSGSRMKKTHFFGTTFYNTNFSHADLEGADFKASRLASSRFLNSDLKDVILRELILKE